MNNDERPGTEEASWLAGSEACEAHLVYVAAEIQNVTLSAEDIHIQGRLGVPNTSSQVPFIPDAVYGGRITPLRVRGRVRLDYQGRGVTYSFRTRYVTRDPEGRLLLELPRIVSRSDRRLVFRYQTHGDPAIQLVAQGRWTPPGARALTLYDVSTDGVGFLVGMNAPALERGGLLSGEIGLPVTGTIVSLLRITSVRPFVAEPGHRIVGARYLDMHLNDRMGIALALSLWAQGRSTR